MKDEQSSFEKAELKDFLSAWVAEGASGMGRISRFVVQLRLANIYY